MLPLSECASQLKVFNFAGDSKFWNKSKVRLVTDTLTNKPKGYAFIEYLHTRGMKDNNDILRIMVRGMSFERTQGLN
ncbi:hypothetical protein PIB30_038419 [Stylosanthes scabra]|uniref:Uncharacterized protein n=1 Tax=Stylosanthes scabra TaxID=79078 RepID=A0ABU6VEP6_9FABA|nr:hypothetical protein [Stylosanthes scabra]